MNLNYSYRAFLITSLLFGIMFLAFKSIKLSKYEVFNEDNIDIEYAPELLIPEEDLTSVVKPSVKIESNRAFNEAEKFISQVENEREKVTEDLQGRQEKANATNEESKVLNGSGGYLAHNKTISEKTEIFSNGSNEKKLVSRLSASKRNSTVSYRLVERSVMDLPNPVYTCDGSGKVVINILVSETGKILKANYNHTSSTTTNECLIDSAIDYAQEAIFSTSSSRPKQLGTITFNFPGQY